MAVHWRRPELHYRWQSQACQKHSLTAVEESNEKDVENQFSALRNHLVALCKTEGQLLSLKEKSLDLAPVPVRTETSVVEILQLWQQVFLETFQQYHRLVKSQDGAAALRLWQEYLHHVQPFLSGSIPEDYDRLTEHQHLCEGLLDKIPEVESQAEHLRNQQMKLLHFCEDALATSIRMEYAAITQRISNLQAGLETWNDFLQRIALLTTSYEDQVKRIDSVFGDIHQTISEPGALPLSYTGMQNRLENLRDLRSVLLDVTKDLEELGVTQKELKEFVSPMDMKTIKKKVWLLWQTQGDLDHHLAVLCHQLDEKLGMRTMFDARQSMFLTWANDIESRVEQGSAAGDPEEVLRRLETELQAEVVLKKREVDWLLATGADLVQVCTGDGETEAKQRMEIEDKVQQVRDAWDQLQNLSKTRANKLHEILQTISQLEIRIAELRTRLYQIEAQLIRPLVFETCLKEVVEARLKEHEDLQKKIEIESRNIADVLNLCELLLSDCQTCKTTLNTETIITATESLEKRWRNICSLSMERKQRILTVWNLLQEVLKLYEEQQQWLEKQEQILKDLDSRTEQKSQDEIQDLILVVEGAMKDIDSRGPALQILDQTFAKLLRDSGLELENLHQLTSTEHSMLLCWHQLTPTALRILQRLHEELQVYCDFAAAHGKAVVWLTNIDVRLTQMQHLATPEQSARPVSRLQQIQQLESELEANSALLQHADELGLIVMERSRQDEIPAIQEMIDEYQLLYKDIKARLSTLKFECKEEAEKEGKTVDEVDESVQVETLKFEQDTAVQVDTLPPLMRLTSRDAYLYKLETAIRECSANLDALEQALQSPTPQQTSRVHGAASPLAKRAVSTVTICRQPADPELRLPVSRRQLSASVSYDAVNINDYSNTTFSKKLKTPDQPVLYFWTPEYWYRPSSPRSAYREVKMHMRQLRMFHEFGAISQDIGKRNKSRFLRTSPRSKSMENSDTTLTNLKSKSILRHMFKSNNSSKYKNTGNNCKREDSPISQLRQILRQEMFLTAWDFDSSTLAHQITLTDDLFLKVPESELSILLWQQSSKNAPNIGALIEFSHRISCLIKTEVMREESEKVRARLITRFINVADKCNRLQNFQSCRSVLAGLQSPAVYRLHKTWTYVHQHHATKYHVFERLCRNYRDPRLPSFQKAFYKASVNPPYLPYIGDFLAKLLGRMPEGNIFWCSNLETDIKGGTYICGLPALKAIAKLIEGDYSQNETSFT